MNVQSYAGMLHIVVQDARTQGRPATHVGLEVLFAAGLSSRSISLTCSRSGAELCRLSVQFLASQNVVMPPGPDIGCYQDAQGSEQTGLNKHGRKPVPVP